MFKLASNTPARPAVSMEELSFDNDSIMGGNHNMGMLGIMDANAQFLMSINNTCYQVIIR